MAKPPDVAADLRRLAERHRLRGPFRKTVAAAAERCVADPGIDAPDLVDLRRLPFVTIDEPWSRDLDQALFVEREGTDTTVWYAIADAAWFVPLHGPLFVEALKRGATAYLPGHNIPMLPRPLSEGVVSLNPGVDRRALVFEMHVDPDGQCTGTTLHRARVHSRAKLTYDGVQAWFDGQAPDPLDDAMALRGLRLLAEVGQARIRDAAERGVVRYRRTEVTVATQDGGSGLRFVASGGLRNDVERYNEQISLLCNAEGARWLGDGGAPGVVQPIYRVHGPPPPERLEQLQARLAGIATAHGLDPARWVWTGQEPLATFLQALPSGGAEGRIARAIHRQAMRVNVRSSHAAEASGHHGVGVALYGRFSAPMREVVGVYLHNEVWEKKAGRSAPLPPGFESAEALREEVIAIADRSRERQRQLDRDVNRLVLDQLLDEARRAPRHPGYLATVMGVQASRVHVQLDAPPIDLKVYTRHLQEQHGAALSCDAAECVLESSDGAVRYRVGDAVRLSVQGLDRDADRWVLRLDPAP